MGAGSAPAVSLPDVSLVFGISLLLGFALMMLKPGADFGGHLLTNIALILLAIAMTAHGVYFGVLLDEEASESDARAREEDSARALDAELIES